MNKLKKYIIISMCIIMILIISIIVIKIFGESEKNNDNLEVYNVEKIEEMNMSAVKDLSEYATIERLINIYNSAINQLDPNLDSMLVKQQENSNIENIKNNYREKGIKILEEILEKKYLYNNKIDELLKYSNNKFYIEEMKEYNIGNIVVYLLKIKYLEKDTNIILFKDNINNTFSILPSEYLKNKNIEENNIIDIVKELKISKIEKNSNNTITEINLDDEKACLKYYYDYLNMLRNNNIDKLYLTLDKDYREKRFENIEEFKEYINSNKERLEKSILSNYQVKDRNGYTEYMCVDKSGNYYIFNATSAMNYTMYLDTYTVDLPEFKGKYSKANEQEKVVLNIGKIIAAINNEDYKYVYSKLSDSFKNNYFNNEDALKEFLQKNIYRKNEVKCDEFEREGNIYTYKVRIIKKDEEGEEIPQGKDAPYRKFNIVMQLKEESDFVMSFSIDE